PILQFPHGIGEAADAATLKLVIELAPRMIGVVAQMLPVQQYAALICPEFHAHAFFGKLASVVQMLVSSHGVTRREELRVIAGQRKRICEGPLPQCARSSVLFGKGSRYANPTMRIRVLVVEDHECALVTKAVRICEDVLVDRAEIGVEVVEEEVANIGEERSSMKQRSDLLFVTGDHPWIGRFVVIGTAILHSVALREAFHLSVAKHWKARQRRH